MIDNIIHNFNIDKYFLALPTGSIFLLVVSILYINKQYPSEITLVSIDAMYWVVLYQTSNYIIRYLPILNISSELRNINLLYFSEKYSVNDLIKSKYRLLFQFTLPITVVNILVKLVILILNGMNFIGFILTIFLTIILTITSHIISLKWTLIGPKFNFDNIFMIRQERFDTQILQQFTIIPFRVITIFLGFAFFIVNFIQVQIPGGIYIIYNVLCLLICILFILLLYRRSNNEYYSKI